MRYLIDTHTLLWTVFKPEKLSRSVQQEMGDPENEVAVSIISFWEISLKYALGKPQRGPTPDSSVSMFDQTGRSGGQRLGLYGTNAEAQRNRSIPLREAEECPIESGNRSPYTLYFEPSFHRRFTKEWVMEERLRIGIIGCGTIGGYVLDAVAAGKVEKTRIRILADPTVRRNTHEIVSKSDAGKFTVTFENVPDPENPKTSYMACYSMLAALKNLRASYRVGT